VKFEITELNSPTALQRFGAPFKSDFGEVSPLDSDLPILRYIFVHHVREFPFLDKAKEKEFWQDKLQVVRVFSGLFILCNRFSCHKGIFPVDLGGYDCSFPILDIGRSDNLDCLIESGIWGTRILMDESRDHTLFA